MANLVPPKGRSHLIFDRRSRRWVNPNQEPIKPRLSPGSLLRHRMQNQPIGDARNSSVLISRSSKPSPDPEGIGVCPLGMVSFEGELIAEPEWEEGGEYVFLNSQSPAMARAVHQRISGSHISALFAHDDTDDPDRWLVRVGTSYIDVQGVTTMDGALRDHPNGIIADVSELEMMDILRDRRTQEPQNWELARERVERIPGLVVPRS